MNTDLATLLDTWMRSQNRWVSADEICQRFQVNERRLRWDQGKPGLLSTNCVSDSAKGYKHVALATWEEFEECDRKDRKHNVSRYLSLRARRVTRRNCLRGRWPDQIEAATGQATLFPL